MTENGHGGPRPNSGRKPRPDSVRSRRRAEREARERSRVTPSLPAEPKAAAPPATLSGPRGVQMMLEIIEASKQSAKKKRPIDHPELNPYRLPIFPKGVAPPRQSGGLAMDDNALLVDNLSWAATQWGNGTLAAYADEGLVFLGYPYLAELAQRTEYRVISETIADDATRKWIDFDVVGDENEIKKKAEDDPEGEAERAADPDEKKKRIAKAGKTDKVKALRDDQERLQARDKFYALARDDGFFGRGHLFYDIGRGPGNGLESANPEELQTPIGDGRTLLSAAKIGRKSLRGIKVVEATWVYPLTYNAMSPLSETFYNPDLWYVMGRSVHGSRLQRFVGRPVPDMLKPAYAFGGVPLSQLAKPYVDIWLTTSRSVAEIIHSFSVMVLMTDVQTILQPGCSAADLITRVEMFNAFRDNQGTFVINKATEDFKNVSASLSGLHELQAQAQEHLTFAPRIPLVKLTGIQPAGLNASSEGEIIVYDDTIAAYQNRFMRPHLTTLVNLEQLSLFGEVDPEITFEFEPLRELTEKERGERQKADAERHQIYVDMGAFSPEEVRGIAIDDPDLPYTGLNPEDVPDLKEEETEGLAPEGGGGAVKAILGEGEKDGEGGGQDASIFPFDDAADEAADADWNESDHPRGQPGNAGQFGSGGGGSSGGSAKGGGSSDPDLDIPEFLRRTPKKEEPAAPPQSATEVHTDAVKRLRKSTEENPRAIVDLPNGGKLNYHYSDRRSNTRGASRGAGQSLEVVYVEPGKTTGKRISREKLEALLKDQYEPAPKAEPEEGGGEGGGGPAEGGGAAPEPEGGTGSPPPEKASQEAAEGEKPIYQTKKEHAAALLERGTTAKELMAELGWPSISVPATAKSVGMKLEKIKKDGVTMYKGTPMTAEERTAAGLMPEGVKRSGGPASRPPETWSMLEFIVSQGGIDPNDKNIGDLYSVIGTKNKFIPGFGMLVRPGGKRLDRMRESAVEAGYIQDEGFRTSAQSTSVIGTLLDAVDQESRGDKVYRQGQEPEHVGERRAERVSEENRAHNDDRLDEALRSAEMDPESITGKQRDRILQIMEKEGVTDPLEALEREAMEWVSDGSERGNVERVLDDIPGWDVPDDARAAPKSSGAAAPF